MNSEAPAAAGINQHQGYGSKSYRAYALGALLVIYIFNAIDRMLISVLQEKIKVDLQLSDFQLGLLGGPAFVILYTLSQLPIARLAERANRITIISVGAAVWSFATATCGMAGNFIQLGLSRIAVGIGEAACIPPSHSALSDYFSSKQRATAFAIFGLGIPIGTMVAAVVGGTIAQNMDWRWAFYILGIPGVIAAILLKLTVKEPPRAGGETETPSFTSTLKYLMKKRSYFHILIGGSLMATFGFSTLQFMVSYFMRSYDMDIQEASAIFGLIAGLGVAAGIFFGGFFADRLTPRFPNALARLPSIALFLAVPIFVIGYIQNEPVTAAIFLGLGAILAYSNVAPTTAIGQSVSEPRMRATASAILLTANVLIGYGLGPPLVGAIADFASRARLQEMGLSVESCSTNFTQACTIAGAEGLQVGLMCSLVLLIWSSIHYWMAGRTLQQDKLEN